MCVLSAIAGLVVAPGKYRSPPYEAVVATLAQDVIIGLLEYAALDDEDLCGGKELAEDVLDPGEGAPCGLFFQGWNPFPTAASANGGGDLLLNLLH